MTSRGERTGVVLKQDESGTSVLRSLLERARTAFPEAFESLPLPDDAATFRGRYAELVPQFEALRVQSARRTEIARAMCDDAGAQLSYADGDGERPLREALCEPEAALPLVHVALPGTGRLVPRIDFRGRLYEGAAVTELGSELCAGHLATSPLVQALARVAERAATDGGLSLAGERFVLLGAGAELSPVYALLEAGAEVLWLDLRDPPVDHLLEPRLGGVLHYVEGGVDLLAQPRQVRATIARFAGGRPVHLGSLAFAGGAARELRLDFTMLELVRSLPRELVGSVAFLLSPTSASPIDADDAAHADERRQGASAVQRALLRTSQLTPGHVTAGSDRISCAVVSQQGASYQAGEYVGKRLAAEALFEFGSTLDGTQPGALPVSVNMVPITETASLRAPLLEAAVLGAARLDMLITQPSTARAMSALLAIHDALDDSRAARELAELSREARLKALFARQFHGGVYAQPYGLEGLIRMAALRGITQRPKLAFEILR